MKTVDKYNATKNFNITAVDVGHLVVIARHYGSELNNVVYDARANEYVVRLIVDHAPKQFSLVDVRLELKGGDQVCELERETIYSSMEAA